MNPTAHRDARLEARGAGGAGTPERFGALPGFNLIRVGSLLAILLFLPFPAVMLGMAWGLRGEDLTMLALAMVTCSLAGVPLAVEQGRNPARRHIMYSLIALVFIANFGLPAMTIYIPAAGPIDSPGMAYTQLIPRDIIAGQIMVIVGLLASMAGYAVPLGRTVASFLPTPRLEWNPRITMALGALMIPLGWLVYAGQALGIIPAEAGSGVVGTIAICNIYANVLLAIVAVRERSSLAMILIGINVLIGGLYGLITSDKEEALVRVAVVAVTVMLVTGRIRGRWILAGVLAVTLIYPISNLVRRSQGGVTAAYLFSDPSRALSEAADLVQTADPIEYFALGLESTTRRFDGLGVASVLIRDTPGVSPFQHGRTLALFFVAFVPRTLWPEKPNIQIGQWINDVYGSGAIVDTYVAPTPIGEYYINFGLLGVVLGMFSFGFLLRVAHEVLLGAERVTPAVLMATLVIYTFSVKFMGSIAGNYGQVVFALVPIIIAHWIVTRLISRPVLSKARAASPPWSVDTSR